MTRARDTSRSVIGIGTAVDGSDEFTYYESSAKHITTNLTLDSTTAGVSDSIICLDRTQLVVDSSATLNIGTGKKLVVNNAGLPLVL